MPPEVFVVHLAGLIVPLAKSSQRRKTLSGFAGATPASGLA
jgi:hypothetical protein